MEGWKTYPPIETSAPVAALAAGQGWLWAGGAGGVMRTAIGAGQAPGANGDWATCSVGLPLASVSALVFASGWLFAGGADGLARSKDGGRFWERGLVSDAFYPVACLVTSPAYEMDYTVMAGTLGGGVLRSDDAGSSWKYTNFGLQNHEVLALAWSLSGAVLAATSDGIYRSTNAGRAWRSTEGSEGLPVSGLAFLPGGRAVAAIETGGLLYSDDGGASWTDLEVESGLPEGELGVLAANPAGDLYLSAPHSGIFHAADGGQTWRRLLEDGALSFALEEAPPTGQPQLFAGLTEGVARLGASGGEPPEHLPAAALHDLRTILVYDQVPVVAGLFNGAWIWSKKAWRPLLPETAEPEADVFSAVTALAQAPDGALLLSGTQGLLRSTDAGKTWQVVLPGEAGLLARITFRANGQGWAASADSTRLLSTNDHGQSWKELPAPFGVLPLATLQATAQEVIAATYDPRQLSAQIWYTHDDGQTWQRGAQARTPWPVVAAAARPPLLTLGGIIFVLQPNRTWLQHTIQEGAGVRRVASRGSLILALTTRGLFRSSDRGKTWSLEPDCPPDSEILDLTIANDTLFLLLSGGRVYARPIAAE